MQIQSHGNNIADNGICFLCTSGHINKSFIQFQTIRIDIFQHAEGRITGAEIINGNLETKFMERFHYITDMLYIFKKNILCNFQIQFVKRNIIFSGNIDNRINKVRIIKMAAGHINRDSKFCIMKIFIFPLPL